MSKEALPLRVQKRDGGEVEYDSSKISAAITKACASVGIYDPDLPQRLTVRVEELIGERYAGLIPGVEDVQNLVETTLIRSGYQEVARSYILYRQKRQEVRELKKFLGVSDELKLPINAIQVLKKRYLLKDDEGNLVESTAAFYQRVARAVAGAEAAFGTPEKALLVEDEFYAIMTDGDFLPNSPTLMNAGTDLGQLSACFVIPVDDSLPGIFEAVKDMAIIQQSGGGTGFSFNRLRSQGDMVQSTHGVASGPVSFMRIFDTTTNVIKQGGRRRGANMGILRVDHPDIMSFITAKEKEGSFNNFNLSVAVTDRFMQAVLDDDRYPIVNPRDGLEKGSLRARDVFDLIVASAWKSGDPGVVFIDEINRFNPTPQLGEIESTNPCGEQPLLPYESCNLGSINISRFVDGGGGVDFTRLGQVVHQAVRFLDNVIEVNHYPLPEIRRMTLANRKIGLGVMGFAEMLIRLGIPYDSDEALGKAEEIMGFISTEGHRASRLLGLERGAFANFQGSVWEKGGEGPMRNATVTTVAPTGTISILAGTSSGIEPLFAISFMRDVLEGTKLLEVNPLFEEAAVKAKCYSRDLALEIAKKGSIQHLSHLPEELRRIFVTSMDIAPEWHVRMQAAFQKHTDNAVSKTVNLPEQATPEDVRRIFLLAHELRCKGITVYRYGSRSSQVLYLGDAKAREQEMVVVATDFAGECPGGTCEF